MTLQELLEGTITNPIIVKELRATFRGKRFFVTFLLILGLFTLILFGTIALSVSPGQTRISSHIGQSVFLVFVTFVFLVSVFVFPAFSCTAIVSERERKTYEMLLVTGIRPWELVLGKFMACMCYVVTFIGALLPLVFVSFLFGGVGLTELIAGVLLTLGVSSAIVMVSLFVSSLVPSARMAVMVTYGPLLFLGTVGFCPCICCGGQFVGNVLSGLATGGTTSAAAAALTSFGVLLPALSPLETFFFLGLAPLSAWGLFVGWFYLLTTNRMRPSWSNRATPMRIFYLLFLAVGLLQAAMGITWAGPRLSAADLGSALSILWCVAGLCIASALSFPAENPILTYRMREEFEALRDRWSLRRLLFPGPRTGAVVLIGGAALAAGLAALLLSPAGAPHAIGPVAMAVLQAHAVVPLLGTLVLAAGFGLLLGTYDTSETLRRWGVYLTAGLLAGLPFLVVPSQAFSYAPGPRDALYYVVSGFSFVLSALDLSHLTGVLSSGTSPGALGHFAGPLLYASVGLMLAVWARTRRGFVERRLTEVARKETTIIRRKRGPAALRDLPPPDAPPVSPA